MATVAGIPVNSDHWIGGERVSSPTTFDDHSPIDQSLLATIARGGPAEVDAAVTAAQKAFPAWAATSRAERARLLHAIADGVEARLEDLAIVETTDNGALLRSHLRGVMPRVAHNFRFFADWLLELGHEDFETRGHTNHVSWDPAGVCALITPWNAPLMLATWKIAPALAAGNTVVLKPAEWTPLTASVLAVITALFGLTDFAFIGLYASYLREQLHFSPSQAGFVVGLSGLAAFASPLGGLLVDRLNPRVLLPALNLGVALCGAALFLGPGSMSWQAVFSFLFGLFASSGVYVAAAGYLVKSVSGENVSRAAGLFVTCVYVAAGVSGLLFSSLVTATGWTAAAMVQIVGFSVLGAALALLLRPHLFSTTTTQRH
ncbi:aldehyde dehydrogenase family protein [Streptosporangium algeriense]|uniref:Aldehyde dehydrogenase family protein n=1 Tax=Streptosporangium algeriense TaxID=1682748 RepID=A0ABW3DR19_9ACTN